MAVSWPARSSAGGWFRSMFKIINSGKIVPVGFINDDTNEVGKVHLGVLYHINLNNTSIEINEKEKMTGQWIKKSQLKDYYPQMESWSKIYVDLQSL